MEEASSKGSCAILMASSAAVVPRVQTLPSLPSFPTITLKLDRSNYLYWKVQILTTVRAHGFEEFLLGTTSPPVQFLENSTANPPAAITTTRVVNPDYTVWVRSDSLLHSWLLQSVTESMLGYVNRCSKSCEVWSILESLFHSQSKARAMHLRVQLQTTKKGSLSVEEFVLKMRGIADALVASGQIVLDDELVSHVLAGLGLEFESVVINLSLRSKSLNLQDVQFALQTHEMRIHQFQASANVSLPIAQYASSGAPRGGFSGNRGISSANRGGFGRGRGKNNGGFNNIGNKRPACQICGKTNHISSKCFKHFDESFPGINLNSAQAHVAVTDNQLGQSVHFQTNQGQEYGNASNESSRTNNQAADMAWYVDSGATHHVTSDLSNLAIQN